jgi:hypothetical protein
MSGIATAVVGGAVVSGYLGSKAQKSAASTAAGAQVESTEASISEQRRQFDALTKIMSPYVTSGNAAMQQQLALLGLEMRPVQTGGGGGGLSGAISGVVKEALGDKEGGDQQFEIVESPEAQRRAVSAIEQSPFFQAMAQQGENAMLQQASATGGLRGGNTQAALAQFRPGLLNQMVQQRFANLGGLTQIGQASAAGQAAQGMQSANAIGNLLTQQGQAIAGSALASGQATANMWGNIGGAVGTAALLKGMKVF